MTALDLPDGRLDGTMGSGLLRAVEQSGDAVWLMDPARRVHFVNALFADLMHSDPDACVGRAVDELLPASEEDAGFHDRLRRILADGETFRGMLTTRRTNGQPLHLEVTVSTVRDADGEILGFVGNGRDVSERIWTLGRLSELTYYDSLTGLPNRRLFFERLQTALEGIQANDRSVAVLFIDLDGFKQINDTLGHSVGDAVLAEVAERLQRTRRPQDTLARLGGDEFLLMKEGCRQGAGARGSNDPASEPVGVREMARRLLACLDQPVRTEDHEFHLTASIGISYCADGRTEPEELIKQADLAMYQAKEAGENSLQFFAPRLTDEAAERLMIEQELRKAVLSQSEWSVAYQTQVRLDDSRPVSVEALARWNHPELGSISPTRFIPVAEDTGLIRPIGVRVLRTACRDLADWQRQGLNVERVSVNVSPRQLTSDGFPDEVRGILEETGVRPDQLELEVTETVYMQGDPEALRRLRRLGVRIAIDDFGTGFSSMSYLKDMPADTLKIDRSFIRGINEDPGKQAIVQAVLAIGRSLHFEGVAEGIEQPAELEMLRGWGCTLAQGFLFSRPVPAPEVPALFRRSAAS